MPRGDPEGWPALAEFTGSAYLRYAFTRGTEQETSFLMGALGLVPGQLVLDAGCGPGRHAHALARLGLRVVGLDLAPRFVELASTQTAPDAGGMRPQFVLADVRRAPLRRTAFDAVICLGQGGFGLLGGGGDELGALVELTRLLRPGGALAVTGFSAYYAVRWMEEGEEFDPAGGVHHELARVRGESGTVERSFPLASTCFTPRELRLMAAAAGLTVEGVWSVEPGRWARREPRLDMPEWLMVARKPGGSLCFPPAGAGISRPGSGTPRP